MSRRALQPGNRQLHGENGKPVRLYERELGIDAPREPWSDGKCGTYAGYLEHYRNKDPLCEECRQAHNDYIREWRLRTGRVKSIRVRLTPAQLALLRGMS